MSFLVKTTRFFSFGLLIFSLMSFRGNGDDEKVKETNTGIEIHYVKGQVVLNSSFRTIDALHIQLFDEKGKELYHDQIRVEANTLYALPTENLHAKYFLVELEIGDRLVVSKVEHFYKD